MFYTEKQLWGCFHRISRNRGKKKGIMKEYREAAQWSHPGGCGDPPHSRSAPEPGCAACSPLLITAARYCSSSPKLRRGWGPPGVLCARLAPSPGQRQGRGSMGEGEILLFSFRRWDAGNQVQSFKSSKVKH